MHVPFDNDGKFLKKWGGESGSGDGQFHYITSLSVDEQGNVFVADFINTRIQKFDKDGRFLMKFATEPPIGPSGVVVDHAGNIYVMNHRNHEHYVQKFDSAGHLLLAWGAMGTGDGQFGGASKGGPDGIAIDQQGNVYASDPLNCRVQKFDPNGKFLAKIGSCGSDDGQFRYEPNGIAVDRAGNIYAAGGARTLQKFDSSGRFLEKWMLAEPGRVVAVDAQGNIYLQMGVEEVVRKFRQR